MTTLLLRLISLLLPRADRPRWREEWLAETEHGGRRMLAGALPDALAVRATRSQRRTHRPTPLRGIVQDLRFSVRSLIASPGFVLGVVLSLGTGLSATVAAFSVVNSLALKRPAGIHKPSELRQISVRPLVKGFTLQIATYEMFRALQSSRTLAGVAAARTDRMTVGFPGEPLEVRAVLVSDAYFSLLGAQPTLGRLIAAADEDVAVLSHATWTRHFGGEPSTIGRTLRINGRLREIVGVAAPGFTGTRRELDEDNAPAVWLPLIRSELHGGVSDEGVVKEIVKDDDILVSLIGRIADGVPEALVQAELAGLMAGALRPGMSVARAPIEFKPLAQPDGSPVELIAFMTVPFFVLALACVNAGNLLNARATRRLRDAAVRLALGASTWRIVRMTLVEGSIMAAVSAGLGLSFSYWICAAINTRFPIAATIDVRVLLFTIITTSATTLGFSVTPAIAAAGRAHRLSQGMRRAPGNRTQGILIGTQAALSLGLLMTGWQFINTVQLSASNDGLHEPDRLVVATVSVDDLGWPPPEISGYFDRAVARVQMVPGVTHVSDSCACDPWGAWGGNEARLKVRLDDASAPVAALSMFVGGDYFGAVELPTLAGRTFRPNDHRSSFDVVVVNQPFADQYLGAAAVGRVLALSWSNGASRHVTIAGVVAAPAVKRNDSLPMVFYPAPMGVMAARMLFIRFDRPAYELVPAIRAALREVHPDVARPIILTAEQRRWERHLERQFIAAGVSFLGLLALVLSAGGLYGVVASAVALRAHEIAVRMALGSESTRVVRLILRQALTPAAIGGIAGGLGAVLTGLVVRSRLYGASPVDPTAVAGAAALLMGVLFLATVGPARRAAKVNPVELLRND